jgi:rhodanese-related sulfurtransferase
MLLCACGNAEKDGGVGVGYKEIIAAEANQMIAENDAVVLVDVRSEKDFAEKRIKGAIRIPEKEVEDQAEELLPDPDAVIILYCDVGKKSRKAAKELSAMGYTNLYTFAFKDWTYDTVSD